MALPSNWVDHLFAKLAIRYGDAFARQWPDVDIAWVKADWSEVLDGLSGDALSHGLKNLPHDRPPNAMQFRALCIQRPSDPCPALTDGSRAAPPEGFAQRVLSMLDEASKDRLSMTPGEACKRRIHEIAAERGYMTQAQRDQLKALR